MADEREGSVGGGPVLVTARMNGPLHVKGSLEIVTGAAGAAQRTSECFLCRCGASANKPFCDGSHKTVSFKG